MTAVTGRAAGRRGNRLSALAALGLLLLGACDSSVQAGAEAGALAQSAFGAGDYVSARAAARQAVAHRDDVAEYWLLLGRSELELQEFESAYEAFQRAQELDPSDPEALRALADLSVMMKRSSDAAKYTDQILALDPGDPRGLIAKGLLKLDRGDAAGAAGIADEVIKRDPRYVGALALKAKTLVATGKAEQGAGILENAMRVHGQNEPLLEALLEIYRRSGDAAGEQSAYTRLLALTPGNVDLPIDYARSLYRRGNRAGAFEQIVRLHRANPDDSRVPGRIANLWLDLGNAPAGLREIRLLGEDGSAAMRVAMARYAAETRWPAEAVRLLAAMVPEEPSHETAGVAGLYAEALHKAGRPAEAGRLAERILALD
jgi:tetratricopeptide (TPR) repeat protein